MTHDSQSTSPPSRSQQRRQALKILKLSQRLAELSPGQCASLPLSPELRIHLSHAAQIRSAIARKRELAFLAKQLRREPEEALIAIAAALDASKSHERLHSATLHRVETWRSRLLTEGDRCFEALRETYPQADIQLLRQLVRNALKQQAQHKPPHAFKALFRALHALDTATTATDNRDQAAAPSYLPNKGTQ